MCDPDRQAGATETSCGLLSVESGVCGDTLRCDVVKRFGSGSVVSSLFANICLLLVIEDDRDTGPGRKTSCPFLRCDKSRCDAMRFDAMLSDTNSCAALRCGCRCGCDVMTPASLNDTLSRANASNFRVPSRRCRNHIRWEGDRVLYTVL